MATSRVPDTLNDNAITVTVSGPVQMPREFLAQVLHCKLRELGFKAHHDIQTEWDDATLRLAAARFFSPITIVAAPSVRTNRTRCGAFQTSFLRTSKLHDAEQGYHLLRQVLDGKIDGVDFANFIQQVRQLGVKPEFIRQCLEYGPPPEKKDTHARPHRNPNPGQQPTHHGDDHRAGA